MRPPSIVTFERLFLGSLALSVIAFIVGYGAMMEQSEREPALQQLGLGGGFVTGAFAVGVAVYLLLWFLIARKASRVAKWILVVLSAIGLFSFLYSLATGEVRLDLSALLGAAYYVLEIAAVVCLFRTDANAWFRKEEKAEPAAVD